MNQAEKRKWQWRNAIKLAIVYCLIIMTLLLLDYLGVIPQNQMSTVNQDCAIMGEEIITMSECYEIMLNGL